MLYFFIFLDYMYVFLEQVTTLTSPCENSDLIFAVNYFSLHGAVEMFYISSSM
jgi:hypothetical protein